MFNTKYLAMHKVQMHAGAISILSYVFVPERAIIPSLKLVDYLPVYNTRHAYHLLDTLVKSFLDLDILIFFATRNVIY